MSNRLPVLLQKLKTRLENTRDRWLIHQSDFFDPAWYLKQYPDVDQAGIDPAGHYLRYGGSEGRDPGPLFDSRWYLETYPDVKTAGMNPLVHFLRFGRLEGRQPKDFSARADPLYQHLDQLTQQVLGFEARLTDLETYNDQLKSILVREAGIPLPPPKHLQVRVVGGYPRNFIESGFSSVYPALNRALKPSGKELTGFHTILDFGCGCGRAVRALATLLPDSEIHGTDIDSEAIEWLNKNYSKYGRFTVAPSLPPTPYADRTFDFIFGISVLTHLPEEMQFLWLEELKRIAKPKGYIVLTTHGEKHYRQLDPAIVKRMEEIGFFYTEPGFNYGASISLPDFYQNAYHSHAYIRREWSKYFDIIEIQSLGIDDHQDTILLQKRPD